MTKDQIQLLKDVRSMLPNHSGMGTAMNAVYISPAQQLRNQADRMEWEQKTTSAFIKLIEDLDSLG